MPSSRSSRRMLELLSRGARIRELLSRGARTFEPMRTIPPCLCDGASFDPRQSAAAAATLELLSRLARCAESAAGIGPLLRRIRIVAIPACRACGDWCNRDAIFAVRLESSSGVSQVGGDLVPVLQPQTGPSRHHELKIILDRHG